jgi:Arc/MetJ-type ribon-helix-helix transcriptional regulator
MAELAPRSTPNRERYGLTLAPDVAGWMEEHCRPGGYFGSPSHAVERALNRLRREMELVREQCRVEKQRFDVARFWRLHAADIDASAPGLGGRPVKDASREPAGRVKVFASLADELTEWIQPYADGKPFQSLSHAIETGLRVLQHSDDGEPRPPRRDELWLRYQAA